MEKLIRIHRDVDQLNFKKIWQGGLFVFDSNVLLDLYRLPQTAKEDLISIFKNEKFKSQIWIGFQVILEFLNNRYEAISDQKNKFHAVRTILEDSIEQHEQLINSLNTELSSLKLKQRHSLIDPDKFITNKTAENTTKFLHDFIDELEKLEKKQSDVDSSDKLKNDVFNIFDGKIGLGFDKKKLQEIYKEGDRRYDAKIPPGFKDIKKEGSYLYEDKEYIRKYGDLILWKEIIEKAKELKSKYVVLVTGDVKEDWWFEKRGKKLGPRRELLNEIYSECPDLDTFYMYDTSTFLQYAKKELEIAISETSISDAKQLIEFSRQKRQESKEGMIYIPDAIRDTAGIFENIRLGIGKSVKDLPLVKLNLQPFIAVLVEIFQNVMQHGGDHYIGIQATELENLIFLRFKNLKQKEKYNIFLESYSGRGIELMRKLMAGEGIDVSFKEDEKRFTVELYIPKIIFHQQNV